MTLINDADGSVIVTHIESIPRCSLEIKNITCHNNTRLNYILKNLQLFLERHNTPNSVLDEHQQTTWL